MSLLILGLAMWVVVHLFPVAFSEQRQALFNKMGEGPYKGLFSILIIGSIILMVFGWKAIEPTNFYDSGPGIRHTATGLVAVAYILFVVANVKGSRIKQYIRHPQLTGLVVFSIAHLLVNGDNRSIILFATLGLWAFISIQLINRRDGVWQKADTLISWPMEMMLVVIGLIVTAVFAAFHIYLSGVALF